LKSITLIFITLLAGYYFGANSKITRYSLSRNSGYSYYFRISFYGMIMLMLAFITFLLLKNSTGLIDEVIDLIDRYYGRFDADGFTNSQIIYTGIVGFITLFFSCFHFPLNFIISKSYSLSDRVYQRAIKNRDFERLIYRAIKQSSLLQVTMSNGKVYVGYVIRTIDPEAERTELRMLPVLSGYRDDTGTVIFKNKYRHVLNILSDEFLEIDCINTDEDMDDAGLADFEIVLPYGEIRHSSLFDYLIYSQTNNSIK